MQSIVVTDLHGNRALYRLLLRIAEAWKISSVFIAGDLAPSAPPDVGGEADVVGVQRAFFRKTFSPLFESFLTAHRHTHVYAIMGNDDRRVNEPVLAELDEAVPNFHLLDDRLIVLQESRQIRSFFSESVPLLQVAGYPYVPPGGSLLVDWVKYENGARLAPMNMDPCTDIYEVGIASVPPPRDSTIAGDLGDFEAYLCRGGQEMADGYDPRRTVYLFHAPPYDTPLDWVAPQGRYAFLRLPNHVGSSEIRRFIERERPHLVLCGHCHESPVYGDYRAQISGTWCANPGSQVSTNVLSVVQFDVYQPENMKQFYINAN